MGTSKRTERAQRYTVRRRDAARLKAERYLALCVTSSVHETMVTDVKVNHVKKSSS